MKNYHLIHYKQKLVGTSNWIEANGVIEVSPAKFLLKCRKNYTANVSQWETILMWATPITAAEFEALRGLL